MSKHLKDPKKTLDPRGLSLGVSFEQILIFQQKLRLIIRPGNVFPIFYFPGLGSLCELQPQFAVL